MFDDEGNEPSFEETLRSIAREAGRSLERAIDNVDLSDVADTIGVDPMAAREWVDTAGSWLRAHAESLGDEMATRLAGSTGTPTREEPLLRAAPHPLDLPSDEQGLALAALDSGRWTVEPGTDALAASGEGPAPTNALGIVRELRVRDWITADGEITLVGRHALSRWLGVVKPR
jgi:hypothetical protein